MFLDFPEQDPGISFSTLICVGSDPRNIPESTRGKLRDLRREGVQKNVSFDDLHALQIIEKLPASFMLKFK